MFPRMKILLSVDYIMPHNIIIVAKTILIKDYMPVLKASEAVP